MRMAQLAARGGLCVVAVLHDLNLAAAACDRLVVLSGGRVVAEGAPGAVLTDRARARGLGRAGLARRERRDRRARRAPPSLESAAERAPDGPRAPARSRGVAARLRGATRARAPVAQSNRTSSSTRRCSRARRSVDALPVPDVERDAIPRDEPAPTDHQCVSSVSSLVHPARSGTSLPSSTSAPAP